MVFQNPHTPPVTTNQPQSSLADSAIRLAERSGRIVLGLGLIIACLVLLSIAEQIGRHVYNYRLPDGYANLFNVDSELNVPSFFSGFLLLAVAMVLAVVARLQYQAQSSVRTKWVVLSCGFLFMAFDETLRLHERLISPVRDFLGAEQELGVFYYAWVLPGLAVVIGVGLYFLNFLFVLPPRTGVRFVVSAITYLTGVLGMELIGGRHAESEGTKNLDYSILVTIEEMLEMIGITYFLWALLEHLKSLVRRKPVS